MSGQPEGEVLRSQIATAIERHEDLGIQLGTKMREESSAAAQSHVKAAMQLKKNVDVLRNKLLTSLTSLKQLCQLAAQERLYECCEDLQQLIEYGAHPRAPPIEYVASPSTVNSDEMKEAGDRVINEIANTMGIGDGKCSNVNHDW